MNQKEKCLKIREMMFSANGIENGTSVRNHTKWRNLEELTEYLAEFGGSIKHDRKRRRGYFVVHMSSARKPTCFSGWEELPYSPIFF